VKFIYNSFEQPAPAGSKGTILLYMHSYRLTSNYQIWQGSTRGKERVCKWSSAPFIPRDRGFSAPKFLDLLYTVSSLIQQRRLKLFGYVARAAASEDHSRAPRASTYRLPVDWRRPRGRPRQSWLRTIESDLKPLNLGLHSALRRATDRPSWRRIVETAMLFERVT